MKSIVEICLILIEINILSKNIKFYLVNLHDDFRNTSVQNNFNFWHVGRKVETSEVYL